MSIDYESHLLQESGERIKIGIIVNQNLTPKVLCYDKDIKQFKYNKVINWHKEKEDDFIYIKTSNRSAIKCSKDHIVYTYEYKKEKIIEKYAKEIRLNDLIVGNNHSCSSLVIKNKFLPIVLGLILGDGSLSKKDIPSTRLCITHGKKQKEYLLFKRDNIIPQLFQNKYIGEGKSGFCDNKSYSTSSLSFLDINNLINILYQSKKEKCNITKEFSNILTKESWALIYQDDGSSSKNSKVVNFALCTFNLASCKLLRESLIKVFKVKDPKIFTDKNKLNHIRLNKDDAYIFLSQIKNLIHPSMIYKFGQFEFSNYNFNFPLYKDILEPFSIKKVLELSIKKPYRGHKYNLTLDNEDNSFIANNLIIKGQ
tara:strand:+ start:22488 stop:23591 length:1104 start_codon:yes stop_codon:yes gene_type:complete